MSDTTAETATGIKRGELLAVLIVATGIGILAMNMVLPSLPGMATEFDASHHAVQLVLTVFLFALAGAQLVYGGVSDRFGRRPVMIVGLAVFLIGGLICAFAWSLPMLILGRAIQGAGGCAGMVLGRAILRDLYDRDRAASLLGYVTMSMVIAPMIGPALGGLFEETLGWRAGALFTVVTGAVVLALVVMRLPETHLDRSSTAGFTTLLRSFSILIHTPVFLFYTAVMAFTSGTFFAFLGGAPHIVIDLMGRGPGEFGLWAMMIAGGYMAGNFVTGRYAVRIGTRRMMQYGVVICLAGAILVLMLSTYGPNVPLSLFAPMMLVTFANGLVMASAVTSSVSVKPQLAGAAAGLGGFLQMMTGATATMLVGFVQGETGVPVAIVIVTSSVLALLAYVLAVRYPDPVDTPIH
jgi:MFS transporter, DHA1 family, multidrug resistance protein